MRQHRKRLMTLLCLVLSSMGQLVYHFCSYYKYWAQHSRLFNFASCWSQSSDLIEYSISWTVDRVFKYWRIHLPLSRMIESHRFLWGVWLPCLRGWLDCARWLWVEHGDWWLWCDHSSWWSWWVVRLSCSWRGPGSVQFNQIWGFEFDLGFHLEFELQVSFAFVVELWLYDWAYCALRMLSWTWHHWTDSKLSSNGLAAVGLASNSVSSLCCWSQQHYP